MKAFLLAAGLGTRLRPLTDTVPKCLLPVRGRPLLGLWLDLCSAHGITEVLLNTHLHGEAIAKYVRENSHGPKVRISHEESLLGSAGTVFANRDWVRAERDFWILYADVLTNANLSSLLQHHRRMKQVATLGLYEVSNPQQCGIVTVNESGVVQDFVEKPARPVSNLAFSGVLVAKPGILDFLPATLPADLGFHVLPKLVGRMAAFPIREYLLDIGTPEKYAYAEQTWPGFALPRQRKKEAS